MDMAIRNSYLLACVLAGHLGGGLLEPLQAQGGSRAAYIGGTVAGVPQNSGGAIRTTDDQFFRFQSKSTLVSVPYEQINLLEYGQKVDRRYLLAVVVSPVFLLTKARRHFLTIGYADENGRQQALVFQVRKGDIRTVLASLEARTGLKVTYQDEEARRAGKG